MEHTEQYLDVGNGRTLAYEHLGNHKSSTVIIFYHGLFGVGHQDSLSSAFSCRDVHYIVPTLPGWGNTTSRSPKQTFRETIIADTAALLEYLYPGNPPIQLYISGGSFGTVPAQTIYCAPFDLFPPGRYIQGMLLLAPFSPPRYHKEWSKSMNWGDWMMIGPVAYYCPGNMFAKTIKSVFAGKLKTDKDAEKFIRNTLFDTMKEKEKEDYAEWRKTEGKSEGQLERDMGMNVRRSICKTWDGFLDVTPTFYNSDWTGCDPRSLDKHHQRRVLIGAGKHDGGATPGMAKWLAESYANSTLKLLDGGHLCALFSINEMWDFLLGPASHSSGSGSSGGGSSGSGSSSGSGGSSSSGVASDGKQEEGEGEGSEKSERKVERGERERGSDGEFK